MIEAPAKRSPEIIGSECPPLVTSGQPLAGGPDRVLAYAPGAEVKLNGLESKMAADPKTGEIIYVASVQGDTNIDLLTLTKH